MTAVVLYLDSDGSLYLADDKGSDKYLVNIGGRAVEKLDEHCTIKLQELIMELAKLGYSSDDIVQLRRAGVI